MPRLAVVVGGACLALALALTLLVAVVAGSGAGGAPSSGGGASGASPAVPADWLALDRASAATCPGLPWSVLAAIGTVESGSGRSSAPGVWSGANPAGAEGPMQFEPATFAAYATVGPGGAVPPSPYDPADAVATAATMLCANGAGSAGGLPDAVFAYNHSTTYVDAVLTLSLALGEDPSSSTTVVAALSFAAGQLGTPYEWGGSGPGGFDCSGLVQAAYAHAGVPLPRVAQDQFATGPAVPAGSAVAPGDLLFFGSGPGAVEHVGLYVGAGEMIDAPHTGAVVRFDAADWSGFVGATRPG